MDEKKKNSFFSDAGKNAKILFDKTKAATMGVVDQNDDGVFDKEDVSVIAGAVGDAMHKGAHTVHEGLIKTRKFIDEKALRPISLENVDEADFSLGKFIRVTDRDKRRADSEACEGAVGYYSTHKGFELVNIFNDSIDQFDIELYPDADSEFYYVDPSDRDRYIALDDYFGYLKIARINELQKIAQDLGAKYFRVTYKEEKTSFSELKAKGKVDVKVSKNKGDVGVEHDHSNKQYSTIEVAAEMECPGHAPVEPKPVYMQKDNTIQNLIAMRMSEEGTLSRQKIVLKMSNSSGIKQKDAEKIDIVIKGFKLAGNATVASEVQNESRRYLEYEIEF